MNRIVLCLLACGAAGLTGCASVSPPEAATIALIPAPSASVSVLQPRLVTHDGTLALKGAVYRRWYAQTTTRTHLDVVFLDGSDRPLREEIAHFSPRELRRAPRPPAGRGYYFVPIRTLPSGTTKIKVRAHDGEHVARG